VRRSAHLFLGAFFIYNLTLRPIPSGDTSPAALLPFAVWSAAALVISITVQGIGAFCYPNGHWDTQPVPVGKNRQRLWDWRDNQIFRSVAAGAVLEPYRLAYRFLTLWWSPRGGPEKPGSQGMVALPSVHTVILL
jgi:hypothetical protein